MSGVFPIVTSAPALFLNVIAEDFAEPSVAEAVPLFSPKSASDVFCVCAMRALTSSVSLIL